MKRLYLWLTSLPLLLMSNFAWADAATTDWTPTVNGTTLGMAPASSDQSLTYLSQIFGQVGNVLQGGGQGQLLGTMFYSFNYAVVLLGIITFGYIYGKGIMDTASQGEFLGKQNSLWVPLRSIGGMSLLIPKAATGYSAVQIFVMWVVLQGVGAADAIWNQVASYEENHAPSISSMSDITSGSDYGKISPEIQHLFVDMVAQYSLAKKYDQIDQPTGVTVVPGTNGYILEYIMPATYATGGTEIETGTVNWGGSTDPNNLGVCADGDSQGQCDAKISTAKNAIDDIMQVFGPIAQYYADNYDSSASVDDYDQQVYDYAGGNFIANAIVDYRMEMQGIAVSDSSDYAPASSSVKDPYVCTQTTLAGSPDPDACSPTASSGDKDSTDMWEKAKHQGWIFAGNYYNEINTTADKAVNGILPPSVTDITTTSLITGDPYGIQKPVMASNDYASALSQAGITDSSTSDNTANQTSAGQGDDNDVIGGVSSAVAGGAVTIGAVTAATALLDQRIGAVSALIFAGVTTAFIGTLAASADSVMLALQVLGGVILALVAAAWLLMMYITFTKSLFAGLLNSELSTGYTMTNVERYFYDAMIAVFAMLITFAVLLTVYLPLIPYMYFTFATVGWFIAVVEAMIAAPIIALGMMQPDGNHDFWGRAEPGVLVIINIFLRPSLMLFGLIAGILVCTAGVTLVNAGFFNMMLNLGGKSGSLVDPIVLLVYLAMYVIIIIAVVKNSFALIYQIPDKINRFFGGAHESFGSDSVQAMDRTASEEQQGLGQGMKGSFDGAKQAAGGRLDAEGLKAKQESEDEQALSNRSNHGATPKAVQAGKAGLKKTGKDATK